MATHRWPRWLCAASFSMQILHVCCALSVLCAAAAAQSVSLPSGSALVDILVSTLEGFVSDGDAMLVVMGSPGDFPLPLPLLGGGSGSSGAPPVVCDGLPALMTNTGTSNGACFGPDVETTLSCSCILDLGAKTEWEFRVRAPNASELNVPRPITLPSTSVLGVNLILIFVIPRNLTSFKLIGVSDSQVPLTMKPLPGPLGSTAPQLVPAPYTNALTAVEVTNINFGVPVPKPGLFPAGLRNLTLRGCNLTRLTNEFLRDFDDLMALDVSSNQLASVYEETTATQCSVASCPLQFVNVSGNNFKVLPTYLLSFDQLQTIDVSNNPISNFTVDNSTLNALRKLTTFKVSPPPASTECANGSWQQILESRLCVAQAADMSNAGQDVPVKENDGSSGDGGGDGAHAYLVYGMIGGALIVVGLMLLVWRKNVPWRRSSRDKDNSGDSLLDSTLQFDDSHPSVNASLLNDPIIITNRLPYKDLRIANCISKGGFGIVYSGVYNRRRVAIKKIRPDRAGDIKLIESFLKEICLAATLEHPRIVEFIGVSWDTLRNLCAVTEFMERGDLRNVLQAFKVRKEPLTWGNYKTMVALHVAEALTYLHSLNPKIIHRDLKSKNVLVSQNMDAKLADFGISRERHIDETHMTAGIGTSFWIAPEVLLGKDYDERADIFSFGVVLSEIDTDDYPYWNASNPNVGNKAQENMILQMVASGAMRPSFSETCPRAILELADQCLQVDPLDRPTAAEIEYRLQKFISTLPPATPPSLSTLE